MARRTASARLVAALALVLAGGFAVAGTACHSDAFTTTPDDAAADALADDGAPGDAGAAVDGVADAGGDGSRGPYCAQHPNAAFCDDFDEQSDPLFGWTSSSAVPGAKRFTDDTVTPPHALEIAVTDPVDASFSNAGVARRFSPQPTVVHLRAALRAVTMGSYVEALTVSFVAGTEYYQITFALGAAVRIEQSGSGSGSPGPTIFVPNVTAADFALYRELDLQIDVGASTVDLKLDGKPSVTAATIAPYAPAIVTDPSSGSYVSVALYAYNAIGETWTLHYDDVLVEVQ